MTAPRLIEIPTWGTMNLFEALWLLAGLAALAMTSWHLPPLWRDWRWARAQGDRPVLERLARRDLRREVLRCYTGLAVTCLGIYAGSQGSPINGVTYVTLVVTIVLLSIVAVNAVQSGWDWRDRHLAQNDIDKGRNGH